MEPNKSETPPQISPENPPTEFPLPTTLERIKKPATQLPDVETLDKIPKNDNPYEKPELPYDSTEINEIEPEPAPEANTVPLCQKNAEFYMSIGKYEKAAHAYEKIFSLLTGPNVLPILAIGQLHYNLALCYTEINEYDKAITNYTMALDTPGITKEMVAKINCKLGDSYKNLENYEVAVAFYLKAYAVSKEILGEDHIYLASLLTFIAVSYQESENLDNAIKHYQKAIEIYKKQGENGKSEIGQTLVLMAECYAEYEDVINSKDCIGRAEEILLKTKGYKSLETAGCYLLNATIELNSGNFRVAIDKLEKAIDIWEILNFEDYEKISDAYVQKGYANYKLERYNFAINNYKMGLEKRRKYSCKEDEWTAMLYYGIGKTYYKKNEKALAEEWIMKGYTIMEELEMNEPRIVKWIKKLLPNKEISEIKKIPPTPSTTVETSLAAIEEEKI